MSSLKRDINAGRDNDLAGMVQAFEEASYRNDYYTTFSTFLDYAIAEFSTGDPYQFPTNYSDKERAWFPQILEAAIRYTRRRANLWTGERMATGWADPFGSLFEAIAGNFKTSAQGLFFTPESVCTMISQMVVTGSRPGETVCEPACGSGRMILAAAAVNPGLYVCANDIDHACTKMTALNMAMNGVVGEATCMDALWPDEDRYRFGYRIVPIVALLDLDEMAAMLLNLKMALGGAGDWRKQYVLLPLPYERARIAAPAPPEQTAPMAQIIDQAAQVRTSEGTPTLKSLFDQALPKGKQGQLF